MRMVSGVVVVSSAVFECSLGFFGRLSIGFALVGSLIRVLGNVFCDTIGGRACGFFWAGPIEMCERRGVYSSLFLEVALEAGKRVFCAWACDILAESRGDLPTAGSDNRGLLVSWLEDSGRGRQRRTRIDLKRRA